jgi:hypothetical protein
VVEADSEAGELRVNGRTIERPEMLLDHPDETGNNTPARDGRPQELVSNL